MVTPATNILETIVLPHLPQYPIYVVLFRHVSNPDRLAPTGDQFDYTFLDASMLSSRRQLLEACTTAVLDLACQRIQPWLVHARIITALSLSRDNSTSHPPEAFGISPVTRDIVVISVDTSEHTSKTVLAEDLLWLIHGTPEPLTDANLAQVRGRSFVSGLNEQDTPQTTAATVASLSNPSHVWVPRSPWVPNSDTSLSEFGRDWVLYDHDDTTTSMGLWSPGTDTPESLFDDSGYSSSVPDAEDLAWHLTLHIAATSLEDFEGEE